MPRPLERFSQPDAQSSSHRHERAPDSGMSGRSFTLRHTDQRLCIALQTLREHKFDETCRRDGSFRSRGWRRCLWRRWKWLKRGVARYLRESSRQARQSGSHLLGRGGGTRILRLLSEAPPAAGQVLLDLLSRGRLKDPGRTPGRRVVPRAAKLEHPADGCQDRLLIPCGRPRWPRLSTGSA
jgi:hypothetical protein